MLHKKNKKCVIVTCDYHETDLGMVPEKQKRYIRINNEYRKMINFMTKKITEHIELWGITVENKRIMVVSKHMSLDRELESKDFDVKNGAHLSRHGYYKVMKYLQNIIKDRSMNY